MSKENPVLPNVSAQTHMGNVQTANSLLLNEIQRVTNTLNNMVGDIIPICDLPIAIAALEQLAATYRAMDPMAGEAADCIKEQYVCTAIDVSAVKRHMREENES